MFEEDPEARGHAYHLTGPCTMLAIAVLRYHVKAMGLPVLCGDLLDFRPTYKAYFSVENRAKALERLLGPDAMPGMPFGYYLDVVLNSKTTILLPYNEDQQYLLFELVLRSDRGRLIKVWDGAGVWNKGDPRRREEVMTMMDVFYGGDTSVPVYVAEKGDPSYGQCHGAGAFLFLSMCYRALGLKPQSWGPEDEAVARNFLWTCIMNGNIGKFPRLKL